MTTSRYRRLMWASTLTVALLAPGVEGCTFSRAQINAADLEQRVATLCRERPTSRKSSG